VLQEGEDGLMGHALKGASFTEDRKTGITLKDTGIRDEHGLEPIDGIFSSPEKSPAKQNGNAHHSTITDEEDMDIGHST